MDKDIVKAAMEAIRKELRGRMGKSFGKPETDTASQEPGIAEIILGKNGEPSVESEEESHAEGDTEAGDTETSDPTDEIVKAAIKLAAKKK